MNEETIDDHAAHSRGRIGAGGDCYCRHRPARAANAATVWLILAVLRPVIARIAAVTVGLVFASLPAQAQGYVVNGRDASRAEVQLLVSHGAQPGKWLVDGYGISAAADTRQQPAVAGSGRKCWYVLDVQLCD
jgi:hypothetical protein